MTYKKGLLAGFLLLTALGLLAGPIPAAEFSAVVVRRLNSQETQGKVYVKGDKVYREFVTGKEVTITILRPDKEVIWMVMPGRKVYMEMPVTEEMTGEPGQIAKDQASMTRLGTETVNGYLSDKYETSVKNNGGFIKHNMWVSKKLGVPIKITSPDGSFSMDYRDIKEGGVPDSVFEAPSGYQKMTRPAGAPAMK
jgi:outer membrane lipoprotein-sorting protein